MSTSFLRRVLSTLALVLILAPAAFAEQTMTPATAADLAHLSGSNPDSCANMTKICNDCGEGQPSGLTTPWQEGDKWCNLIKSSGSRIDNLNFNYVHTAFDYLTPAPATGCSSCGTWTASAGGAGLIDLLMKRTHRFRNMTEHSSFGPGVFGTYDTSLRISRVNGGDWQVVVFDPDLEAPLILRDSGGGLFRGYQWNKISSLRFYTGSGGSGGVVADPSQAASAVLTAFSGVVTTFELFNPSGTLPAPWTYGEIGPAGSVASHGDAGTANGIFTLSAGGADIGSTADSFGYVYQAIQGDTTITTRVDSLSTYRGLAAASTDSGAKSGIMLRETLDPGSVAVNLSVSPAGLQYISRLTTGAVAAQDAIQANVVAPRWLRLQRVGSVITGSVSTDGATWTVVTSKSVAMASPVYVGLSVTAHDANGVVSDARFSGVAVSGTALARASWPVPATAPYTSPVLAGRLASIADRNGYALKVAYRTWTPAQLLQSPDLPWQMSTVTDAHGRSLSVQYQAVQVSGRWAVSSLTLPTGATVSYGYGSGNDLLRSVAYSADGSASTFTYTPDSYTSSTIARFDDAGATAGHQRKSAYLTNIFTARTEIANTGYYQVYTQASNLIKMLLVNNDTEVRFLNFPQDNLVNHIYEGGGRMKEIVKLPNGIMNVRYFTTWSLTAGGFSGTPESSSVSLDFADDQLYRQDTLHASTDENGVAKTYINDADGFPTTVTFTGDGTTHVYAYNAFKQVTRYKDRLNRVTLTTYDARGNETLKEVGLLFNGTTDVRQPEYATYQKSYYPAGDRDQFLLKTTTDANGNVTTYTYTPAAADGSNHFVKTIVTPNDSGTGTITAWTFGYDSNGRQTTSADAAGRTATMSYDNRDRLVRTTYADNSTDIVVYGTGATKNMVVRRKDRQGSLTEYAYDDAGRVTTISVGANTMSADGATVTATNDGASGPFQSLVAQTTLTYLAGTDLEKNRTVNGNLTTTVYDYRLRKASQTRYPTAATALTTTWTYTNNLLSQIMDAYGRSTYLVYRSVDAMQVRQVQGLIPADTVGANAATIARDTTVNPKYLVTDSLLDAEGQQTSIVDPRNITSTVSFDTRGRMTSRTEASSDATVAGRTDYLYDAQSNQTEVRSPRYFVSADTNGYQKARITMVYTKRNLLQSRTAALGVAGVVGTVSYTYNDDGRQATTTDEDGSLATTIWKVCCARVDAQVDAQVTDATGTFFGTRFVDYTNYGDQTHEAVTRGTTGTPAPGCCNQDPNDAQTLTEATMTYDVRHRQVARTQWFAALAAVDANNPPIAGQNGIAANLGLTTVMRYDDNLTDALGLSNSADPNSVAPYLSGLGLGANAAGSAMVTINPAGEPRWTIMDGLGRVIRVVDGNGHATTTTYDVVDTTTNLVKTTVTDALSHAVAQYADAAGRVRIQEDQLLKRTLLGYDADGNLVSQRDPTNVGQDCVFDARNRRTQCTDTATPAVTTYASFDANSNTATSTDGLGHVTTFTFDARDRKVTVLDRVSGTTTFAYDAHSNLQQITDADGSVTTYLYDPRELLIKETYPPGSATPNSPTTPPLDVRSYTYDAARRLVTRTDQAGIVATYVYDFISRLTTRSYSSNVGYNDTYTYDAASRITQASNNRYHAGFTRSYTTGGEKAGLLRAETQLVNGVGFNVTYTYDAANRLTTLNNPDSTQTIRTYTNRDQLATVKLGAATIAGTMVYDDAGRRTSLPLGNGLTESRTYSGDGMVQSITEGTANAVENLSYVYDANKRVTSETNGVSSPDTQGFGYDNENRVTSWTTTPASQSWVLSKVGDWTSTSRTGTGAFTQARTPWAVHEINTIQQSPPPVGVPSTPVAETSDTKGNLLTDRFGLQSYLWDDENRMTTSSLLASGSNARLGDLATYSYDPLGRRLEKRAGNVITTYVHDGAQVVAEYEAPTFVSQVIGAATAGSLSIVNGTISLAGSGADIGGTADAGQLAAQKFVSDGTITVQVTGLTNTDPSAKAGIVIRSDTSAGAANALIAITPGVGVIFQSRATAGGATTTATVAGRTTPIWLRMVKSGTTFTGQYSADAVTWTSFPTATVSMALPATTGLIVTSRNAAATATGTFSGYRHAAQVTTAGTPTLARKYVYGAYVDEPLALVNGSGTYYYAANRVYSVVALTNSSGAVAERYRYDTYGARTVLDASSSPVTGNVSAAGNQVGFTGRYLDAETGLWNFRSRMYSTNLGRFVARDSVMMRKNETNETRDTSWYLANVFYWGRPVGGDGYAEGSSLYQSYFVPTGTDPTGLYTVKPCNIVVIMGHNSTVPQNPAGPPGTGGSPGTWVGPGTLAEDPCSMTSIVCCGSFHGRSGDFEPATISHPIPGASPPTPAGKTISGADAEKTALADFVQAKVAAPSLCSGPCGCKEIKIYLDCQFGWDLEVRYSMGSGTCGKTATYDCATKSWK